MSDTTDLIKEKLNLADVIGEYVPLKQAGAYWKGLCPFHNEKTPSFVVTPDRGIWHCFGCNEGGDLFTFIQRMEGLTFPEALRQLAERAGVPLKSAVPTGSGNQRTRLLELLALAARFYHEILLHHSVGERVRAYLTERGVTPAAIEQFQLGYAPRQWQLLRVYLQQRGYGTPEMVAAGLITESNGRAYDRFRGRIMFPIHDTQGRVIAFGGRITPWHATGEEGKYVNSPETAVYQKRGVVYNLNRAKAAIRREHVAVVVEGYLDVVLLVQHGIEHVVASSGTAFTPEQVALLKRFTPALHFAFDADAAGLNAAIGATRAALAAGMRVATLSFPAGQDPADVAQANPNALREIVAQPRSLLSLLLGRFAAASAAEREQLLAEILPLVREVSNVVQQGEMIQELAHRLHVSEAVIQQRVLATAPLFAPPALAPPTAAGELRLTAELQLLGLLLLDPTTREAVLPTLTPELFTDATARSLYTAVHEVLMSPDQAAAPADALLAAMPVDEAPLAAAVLSICEEQRAHSSDSAAKEADWLLRTLKRRALAVELERLQQRLAADSPDDRVATLTQLQTIVHELHQLDVPAHP